MWVPDKRKENRRQGHKTKGMIPCELSCFKTVPDPSMQVMRSEGREGWASEHHSPPHVYRAGQERRGRVKDA